MNMRTENVKKRREAGSIRIRGAFFKEELIAQMEETGFRIIAFEDRTVDLDSFVAQAVMDGEEEEMLCPGTTLQ